MQFYVGLFCQYRVPICQAENLLLTSSHELFIARPSVLGCLLLKSEIDFKIVKPKSLVHHGFGRLEHMLTCALFSLNLFDLPAFFLSITLLDVCVTASQGAWVPTSNAGRRLTYGLLSCHPQDAVPCVGIPSVHKIVSRNSLMARGRITIPKYQSSTALSRYGPTRSEPRNFFVHGRPLDRSVERSSA